MSLIHYCSKILRIPLLVTAMVVLSGFLFALKVDAAKLTLSDLGIDVTSVQQDSAYSIPSRILVIPIFPPLNSFDVNDTDWFRGLHYFLVAGENRPGFTDIPFHYVVSKDGRVFEGNMGGEERKISIEGIGDDMLVVGYLADKTDSAFDARAKSSLSELLLEVANRNAINPSNISVQSVEYIRDDEQQITKLAKQELFGLWGTSLKEVVNPIKKKYKPVSKKYSADVIEVTLPAGKVTPGKIIEGKLKIKNEGKYGFYYDTVSEIFGTKKKGSSKFYSTGSWASRSQFYLMPENATLRPGEEATYKFKLYVPLFFGKQQESYHLKARDGSVVSGSGFSITLDVLKPTGTVIQIQNTSTGWLRVRSSPSGVANNEMARVSSGERYIALDNSGTGWVKIQLNDGRKGWVSTQYIRYL